MKLLEDEKSWSDEIPDEIIHEGEYKVRKNWWAAIQWSLASVKQQFDLSGETKDRIQSFEQKFYNVEFISRPTTRADTDEANEFLDYLIEELKKEN
ncbi:MAG: hypothetical protein NTW79_00485 [Candidatus Berkelbacteria bacterium]|nr:hypothetical protein [Candidatus Berkelbacteria bacterium]